MNYRINAVIEVEALDPGSAITAALSGGGNVKQVSVNAVPKRTPASAPAGDEKVAQIVKE